MDRESVRQFVAEHQTGHTRWRETRQVFNPGNTTGLVEPGFQLLLLHGAHGGAALDQDVLQSSAQRAVPVFNRLEEIACQQAFPRAHFDHGKGGRRTQQRVELCRLFREGLPENRMDVGTRIEVPGPADPLSAGFRRAHVVAELWVIEREFHEADERHWSRGGDLGRDGGDEFRVTKCHEQFPLSLTKHKKRRQEWREYPTHARWRAKSCVE